MKTILVTGSAGLIGSEVASYFASKGWHAVGVDNNQRKVFFGEKGDTSWNLQRLVSLHPANYTHHNFDLRDREATTHLIQELRPHAIVHCAAQPSHDLAARIVYDDFEVNALATLNLLEAARNYCRDSPFIFMSTNKVYGDKPNKLARLELATAYRFSDPDHANGISEDLGVDNCLHSLFGASKLSADILVQEYGRYFSMPTVCLRGGCLTGPNHSGVKLHGFLSYLLYCNYTQTPYTIYGYQGKQVRDNIHSLDVARFIDCFIQSPRYAEVYNIGGGLQNSCSILEAFSIAESISGKQQIYDYSPENRIGDHICYYSDLSKMRLHYPQWNITRTLPNIFTEILSSFSADSEHTSA